MIINFLPLYFFLFLFSLPKKDILPYLLFSSIFIDRVCYNLPFINTGILLIFYFINYFFNPCRTKQKALIKTFLYTFFYLLLLSIIFRKFSFPFILIQICWNLSFTFFTFSKTRINLKNKNI